MYSEYGPPQPPYGVAIQAVVATGDLQKMKDTAATAESYLAANSDVEKTTSPIADDDDAKSHPHHVRTALEALKTEIAKLENK